MPLPPSRVIQNSIEPSSLPSTLGLMDASSPLLQAMGDASLGVFEIDLLTAESRWSAGLFSLFGLDGDSPHEADEARARVHPDDSVAWQSAFDNAMSSGHGASYAADYRVLPSPGTTNWLSARGRVVHATGANGSASRRLVGVVTDHTAHRSAEAALVETERRRDGFLALLAHDLRNPLAPLHTAAELMRRADTQPARIAVISEMLARQVAQMAHLLDDLVDVSRANQGRIELRRGAVELRRVLEDAIESVRGFVERRRQRIDLELSEFISQVDVDPERLAQIVTHLIEHSSRSSTEDSTIRVDGQREFDNLVLSVSDDGAGIESDRLPRVFDLYPMLTEDRTQRQTLGTGMALVKALALLHGGSVAAESAGAGQGSRYTLRLPNAVID